ncbi:MAG: FAD binding domain-containing protein [Candidatus Binatia bacterium]
MIPVSFEYTSPSSLEEAFDLLSSKEDIKVLAGGQSLLPLMKLRLARPSHILDLGGIPGLDTIRERSNSIIIGAMTTHQQIENSELLKVKCPLLPQTAATIADVQIRNQGTIGGSLAHADPTADLPAAILALGAEMKAVNSNGERWIKSEDFFLGFLTCTLEPGEILTEIKVPVLKETKTAYLKAAQKASGFAVVGIAVCLKTNGNGSCEDIAIGVTGVTDKAYRAHNVEQKLKGKKLEIKLIEDVAAGVVKDIDVIEDINGSKEYRSHVAQVYVARAIQAAISE